MHLPDSHVAALSEFDAPVIFVTLTDLGDVRVLPSLLATGWGVIAFAHTSLVPVLHAVVLAEGWNEMEGIAGVFVLDASARDEVLANLEAPAVAFVAADALLPDGWHADLLAVEDASPRVGLIAPVTVSSGGSDQRIVLAPEERAALADGSMPYRRRAAFGVETSPVVEVDDTLVFLTRAGVAALFRDGVGLPDLGRWTWPDAGLRLRAAGLDTVVAERLLVPRQTETPQRPEQPPTWRDWANRRAFYARWQERTSEPVVVATILARFLRWRDVEMLSATVAAALTVADAVVVLVGNHPGDVPQEEIPRGASTDAETERCRKLLRSCPLGCPTERVVKMMESWVVDIARGATTAGPARLQVDVWDGTSRHARDAARRIGRGPNVWQLDLVPGEVVAEDVTRGELHRLATHPNPLVLAYDVEILTHWDTARLARIDAPWGSGRGGSTAPRFVRVDSIDRETQAIPAAGVRVSGVRLRSFALLRPSDRAALLQGPVVEDRLVMAAVPGTVGIGLHMLVYEREQPEDVARWCDELHGLARAYAFVWTSPVVEDTAHLRDAFAGLAASHGRMHGRCVDHLLDNHLAQARNAGIDALAAKDIREGAGLAWALFFDPDEWLQDPILDAMELRARAAEYRAGYLLKFRNRRLHGPPSQSESLRMSTLDPARPMRMSGRVHEDFFREAVPAIQKTQHPRVGVCDMVVGHRGLALSDVRNREKLDKYEAMLLLQLKDDPEDSGTWVSLAWHYVEAGRPAEAEKALLRAVRHAGDAYLPFQEMGQFQLRGAASWWQQALARLVPASPAYSRAKAVVDALAKLAPEPGRTSSIDGATDLPSVDDVVGAR
jgi:hypothetical protein